jgi:hypothetical protein
LRWGGGDDKTGGHRFSSARFWGASYNTHVIYPIHNGWLIILPCNITVGHWNRHYYGAISIASCMKRAHTS